jgi:hypothetical protein
MTTAAGRGQQREQDHRHDQAVPGFGEAFHDITLGSDSVAGITGFSGEPAGTWHPDLAHPIPRVWLTP